jgi:hypothetical protein
MAIIEITPDSLIVHIEGADKLWSLKSRLQVPLEHVVCIEPATEGVKKVWQGFRVAGTHVPGVIAAGTFHKDGKTVFWDVHHQDRAVEVQLRDERYSTLVVEVADPEATIEHVQRAIVSRTQTRGD